MHYLIVGLSFVGNCLIVWGRKNIWMCDIIEAEIFCHVVCTCCSVKIFLWYVIILQDFGLEAHTCVQSIPNYQCL